MPGQRRRWLGGRRLSVLLVLALVAGAIVNVAVAWGFSLWPWTTARGVQQTAALDWTTLQWWKEHAPAGFPEQPSWLTKHSRFGSEQRTLYYAGQNPNNQTHIAFLNAYGWPLITLEATHWVNHVSGVNQVKWAVAWGDPPRPHRRLPLVVVWPGFAINSVFYAAMLWLILIAPGVIRRRWRVRRGQCAACGYPVGSSAVCTECGGAVKPVAAEPVDGR